MAKESKIDWTKWILILLFAPGIITGIIVETTKHRTEILTYLNSVWYSVLPPIVKPILADILIVIAWVISPGAYILSYIWITPDSWFGFIAATLLSWWIYATILRMLWIIPARLFGFYSPGVFEFWIGLSVPWRLFYRPYLAIRNWIDELFRYGKQATAKWATNIETMYHLYKPGQLLLGRFRFFGIPLFQPVGIKMDTGRHITIIAGTGSGKSVYLTTLLALHEGNAFVIDCDAQMYNALHQRMGEGGGGILGKGKNVFILDPYNLSITKKSASWNPISEIDAAVAQHGDNAAVGFAEALAEGLIKTENGKNKWVYDQAKEFLTGLILYVWRFETPENRNLLQLRELLTLGLQNPDFAEYDSFDVLIETMKSKDDFNKKISKAASVISKNSDTDSKAPLTEARTQTAWIDLPEMAEILKYSDFNCEELKIGDASVFIAAPVGDIKGQLSRWVRTLFMMTEKAFTRTQEKGKNICLFAIDEMPSLGRIETLIDAAAVFRKYQIRLITVTQDIGKLHKTYPDEWGSFLGSSECIIWMWNKHSDTLNYLSNELGKATIIQKLKSGFFSKKKVSSQREDRELMTEGQLKSLLKRNVIITRDERPFKLKSVPYFKELPVCYYETDPHYRENSLRTLTRRFFVWIEDKARRFVAWTKSHLESSGISLDRALKEHFEGHRGNQIALLFIAVIALLVFVLGGIDARDLIFLVVAGIISGGAWFFLLRSILKDAYIDALALINKTFNKHPYSSYSIKVLGGMFIACFVSIILLKAIPKVIPIILSVFGYNLEWGLLMLIVSVITVIAVLLGGIILFWLAGLLAMFLIPPLLYGICVAVLYPSLLIIRSFKGETSKVTPFVKVELSELREIFEQGFHPSTGHFPNGQLKERVYNKTLSEDDKTLRKNLWLEFDPDHKISKEFTQEEQKEVFSYFEQKLLQV